MQIVCVHLGVLLLDQLSTHAHAYTVCAHAGVHTLTQLKKKLRLSQ